MWFVSFVCQALLSKTRWMKQLSPRLSFSRYVFNRGWTVPLRHIPLFPASCLFHVVMYLALSFVHHRITIIIIVTAQSKYPVLGQGHSYDLPDETLPVVMASRRSSPWSYPFIRFSGDDTRCPTVISYSADGPRSTSIFWLVQSRLWTLCFLFLRYLFLCPGIWCLTYFLPSMYKVTFSCLA